jgi:site-specific DNA-adenine methylase
MQKRFQYVMIENRDFEFVFKQWGKTGSLIYVDPPYADFEHYYGQGKQGFSLEDHERLAQLLNNTQAYVALSYYPHPLVDKLYPADKWRRVTWDTVKHSQRTKDKHDTAQELLLLNYSPAQQSLWDMEDKAS